jgi:hypothetical protein
MKGPITESIMADEIKGAGGIVIPMTQTGGTATFSYEENMKAFRENMAEAEQLLKESEKNVEAIDEWLNRQRQLQHQD